MSIFVTRYKALFALVFALLLSTSCSDQGSTSASKPESPRAPAQEVQTAAVQTSEVTAPEVSQPVAEQVAAADGKKTYQTYCQACHANGVANAPKLGDKDAWAPRIAKGNEAMFTTVIKGLNAMPPKGTCMSCSDDDLRAAMEYMVGQGS